MGEYSEGELDGLFLGLSHRTRRHMMRHLARSGELKVTELARRYRLSLNTVSKHIKILERARLVRRTVHGRDHLIRLDPERLRDVARWLGYFRPFWSVRLENLADLFERRK
jgi:DNA-binding transcriptional ArsR family regulator